MSLIRLIQNLSLNENLPEIIYDKNGRYEKTYRKQSSNDNIQQRTTTGYYNSSMTRQLMGLDERKEGLLKYNLLFIIINVTRLIVFMAREG